MSYGITTCMKVKNISLLRMNIFLEEELHLLLNEEWDARGFSNFGNAFWVLNVFCLWDRFFGTVFGLLVEDLLNYWIIS